MRNLVTLSRLAMVHLFILTVSAFAGTADSLRVGLATRDITPDGPIWLCGYAARKHASDRVDHPLLARAAAFEDAGGERFVLVAVDNCEGNGGFMAPILEKIQERFGLPPESVLVVWSHTHSAPCLSGVLGDMFTFGGVERERVDAYSARFADAIVEVVGDAVKDLKAATLRRGTATARFAMNRRIFRDDRVDFGENPEGPVDHDVPVLSVHGEKGELRAIIFGYACHGTTIHGDDFYTVSGDYMAYAREALEAAFAGAKALYLTGCGADSNPSPRGPLAHARQHGLELAGAVAGVLNRPMRPVRGPIRRAFARIALPLGASPTREKLLEDAMANNVYVQNRAQRWLGILESGKPLPTTVDCPIAAIRLGDDLTFFFVAGEPVVDYSLRLKREFAEDNPWVVGYAMEVPCYIPSARILLEGGYEADSSFIYYGIYGPFPGRIEKMIIDRFHSLAEGLKKQEATR